MTLVSMEVRAADVQTLGDRADQDTVVIAGTNGEAVTLTTEEKTRLIKTTREVAVKVGRPGVTITMGCGGQCTRDVIAETRSAKDAGADYALVLVPSYFHFAMTSDAIVAFFEEVSAHAYPSTAMLTVLYSLQMPAPSPF